MLDDVLAHSANRERTDRRCRGALAGNIAERDGEPAFAVRKKIVEITAQGTRGAVARARSRPGISRAPLEEAGAEFRAR